MPRPVIKPVYMHACTDVCHTLLRLAATQILATSLLLLLASGLATNRKTSPALGLTGGESQDVETAEYHMLLSSLLPRF